MFDIFNINYADGVMSNGYFNGAEIAIINSSDTIDRLISSFKQYVDMGYNPNDVIDRVLSENHVSQDDLTDYDIQKLNTTIERYVNGVY